MLSLLSDDGYFADGTFLTVAGSGFHHIDSASYSSAFQVAAVPGIGAAVASALIHQGSAGTDYLYIRIQRQTGDGDLSLIHI